MDRKILFIMSAGVLLMIMAGTNSALAQAPTPCDAGRAMEVVTLFLDLTEVQREDFAGVLQQSHEEIKAIEEQQRALRRELDEMLDAGAYDLSEVGKLTEQIHALGHEIQEIRKDKIEELLEVLDEEQERKSGIVRRAAVLQPVINAYKTLGILPPIVLPPAPPDPPEE